MLVQEGDGRSDVIDRRLACTLAAVAGALNSAAFYAVGFFSANMTGNVSTLSDHIAIGEWLKGGFYLAIVLTFIIGATVSTLIINRGRRIGAHGIYAVNIFIEGILLFVLGAADLSLSAPWRVPIVVLGLSFLMGLQNAVVTRLSDARVRTTHVSGMATDIGIELGMLLDIARGAELSADAAPFRSRLRLHVETILSFFGGGIVGVLLYQVLGGYMLWIAAVLLMIMAGPAILRTRHSEPQSDERPYAQRISY